VAGQTQTPWLADVNAASHMLNSVAAIGIGTTATANIPIDIDVSTIAVLMDATQINPATDAQAVVGNGTVSFGLGIGGTSSPIANVQGNGFVNVYPTGALLFALNYVERMRITTSGYIGIGTSTPSHQLELSQDSAAKPSTSTWQIISDPRTKQRSKPLAGGLEVINRLQPLEGEYNGAAGTTPGSRVVSLDPSIVREVLPHTVIARRGKLNPDDADETEILHFNPHELIFHLILAVQQLSKQLALSHL
jgi:hypothetical protein